MAEPGLTIGSATATYRSHPRSSPSSKGLTVRILFSATPTPGHLLPLLPLARAARVHGHDVAFLTGAGVTPMIDGDMTLLADGPMPAAMFAEVARRTRTVPTANPRRPHVVAEYFAATRVDLTATEALEVAQAWQPDLIVGEWCDFVAPIAVLDSCPPALQAANWTPPANRISLRPEPHRRPGFTWTPPDFGARADRPLVLATLGTVFHDANLLTRVLAALYRLDVNVLATTGRATGRPHDLHLNSDRVRVVPFVPLQDALNRVSVVVSHGGAGTTLATLAQGRPSVLLPRGADQFDNSERVVAARACIVVEPASVTSRSIASAVERALVDPGLRSGAQAVAREIAAMPSAEDVVTRLANRLVEAA